MIDVENDRKPIRGYRQGLDNERGSYFMLNLSAIRSHCKTIKGIK